MDEKRGPAPSDDLRIDPAEASEMENALFVDARNAAAWGEADTKLPGAIRVPANAAQSQLEQLPRGRTLITYCT